jgi:hypothetical protein|tara:strand:- start:37 stop:288 length:252 start_codon:yes stop_codon:yes gene_type:complete
VKVPDETVLSPPKSTAHTAALDVNPVTVDELYIKHPRAVKEADVQDVSEKSVKEVVVVVPTPVFVRVFPPALYPEPEISLVAL